MKTLTIAGAVALCALFAGTSAKAQGAGGLQQPAIRGIFHPTVGGGADYEMDGKDGTKTPFEISIIGTEAVNGKDAYWMETTMSTSQMGTVVMKMLLVVDGANSHAEKMIVQIPGRGAMAMPMAMMGRNPQAQPPEDIRDKADDLGKESVTVPAGTFSCEHYKSKDKPEDVWVSDSVSPYGLVKLQDKDMSIVLTKQISDVQDKITGPVMDMSQMMGGRMPPPPPQH